MAYFEKADGETVVLHGFEHLKDIMYVYVSPIDGKPAFHVWAWDTPYIRQFSIAGDKVVGSELVRLLGAVDGLGKMVLYNRMDGGYYIMPMPVEERLCDKDG